MFVVFLAFTSAMQVRWGGALADDGAFFLRYAENMLRGEFWVWNSGEKPIWGASAPFFAVILAGLQAVGLSPMSAIVGGGVILGASGLTLASWVLLRHFGYFAASAFVAFACVDSHFMWFGGTAGLESPLSITLVAYGFWALLERRSDIQVGVAAGLLAINKLDLVPAAFFLLAAWGLMQGRIPKKAVVIAVVISAAWYVFAWVYFGLPVPNSFITKTFFQNQEKLITWRWFGTYTLVEHGHFVLVLMALGAWVGFRRKDAPAVVYLGGVLLTHLVAYSIKFPVERYDWYAMPSLLCLMMLAGIGIARVFSWAGDRAGGRAQALVGLFFMGALVYGAADGLAATRSIKDYLMLEKDRVSAGDWVRNNTPKDFRVFTGWGNPAYFSDRHVLDGSFLNRRYEEEYLVVKYKPEVVVDYPKPLPGYTLVRIFDKAREVGIDFPFGVHVRDDVVGKVTNTDRSLLECFRTNSCLKSSRPLFEFVGNIVPGDKYGDVRQDRNRNTIFVHPGDTKPTIFDLDVARIAGAAKRPVTVSVMMSPEVPPDALARGAANVGVTVFLGDVVVVDRKIVQSGAPTTFELSSAAEEKYRFVIDNNGGADTDWVLVLVDEK